MRLLCLSSLLALTAACATPANAYPDVSPSSAFKYSASSPDVPVPMLPTTPAGLIVRPDVALFPLALTTSAPDCEQAVSSFEKTAEELSARLKEATRGAATLHLRSADLAELRGRRPQAGERSRADAVIEVALDPAADFWTRTRLLVKVAQAVVPAPGAPTPAPGAVVVESSLGTAQLRVKDAERYRETLMQTWLKRVREFTAAAQTPGAPLVVTACEPPGEIGQLPLSVEEVSLSLPLNCHLGVKEHP